MTNSTNEIQENTEQPTSTLGSVSEILGSLLKIAQQNVIEKIQTTVDTTLEQAKEAANEIVQNAVVMFIIAILGLIGFIFTIVGVSLWIGETTELGAWFGFLSVGIVIVTIALIWGSKQKNKNS
ncbi:MAG: phage holin family protein [Patescibacteria group bacterium]